MPAGTLVATCMGGLGRQIPSSYAEYACRSREFVIPFLDVGLDVATLAALPEMLQNDLWIPDRGAGSPKRGVAANSRRDELGWSGGYLSKYLGASRIGATSRSASREALLKSSGADVVYVDDGNVAKRVRVEDQSYKVFELIGTKTLKDSILCLKPKGTVCMTGIQGGEWAFGDFSPIMDLPQRRRLTSYGDD